MKTTPASSLHTWLQLVRAPNLFTVPGDPLAGFLLASGGRIDGRLGLAIAASLCFYAHGLLLNDLADLAEDRRDRPNRPLPSGAAQPRTVLIAAVVLAALALLLCWAAGGSALGIGVALLAAIVLYNLWAKKIAVLGPITMGLCRGLSLLLGAASAVPVISLGRVPDAIWASAVGFTIYIALVTNLARIETTANPPKLPRKLPFIGLAFIITGIFLTGIDPAEALSAANIALYLVSAYTLYAASKIHRKLRREPAPPIPPMIGQLIRLLLPLQAIAALASRSTTAIVAAALLLILWPISRAVSRRFYAS